MANLNLKPTAGYILIEPLDKEVKTASGIYLPDSAGEKPQKGKVLAIGDDIKDFKKPCRVGDNVIYKKWGGNEVKIDNKEYMFVEFKDILAVQE